MFSSYIPLIDLNVCIKVLEDYWLKVRTHVSCLSNKIITARKSVLCLCYFYTHRHSRVLTHDLHSWGLIGKCLYFQIETTCCIIYRLSILWGEEGDRKWDDQMGEWSGARGCPENGMLVDRGKGWPGIGAWIGDHGNGDGEMGLGRKMVHIYKHNIPPFLRK